MLVLVKVVIMMLVVIVVVMVKLGVLAVLVIMVMMINDGSGCGNHGDSDDGGDGGGSVEAFRTAIKTVKEASMMFPQDFAFISTDFRTPSVLRASGGNLDN